MFKRTPPVTTVTFTPSGEAQYIQQRAAEFYAAKAEYLRARAVLERATAVEALASDTYKRAQLRLRSVSEQRP